MVDISAGGGWTHSPVPDGYAGNPPGLFEERGADGHTCAVTLGGDLFCWGHNNYGQVGDGTLQDRSTPVRLEGIVGDVIEVSAGGAHTCARTATGSVWCWGRNAHGQLGDGSLVDRTTPVVVSGIPGGAASVQVGMDHSCALTSGGGVMCWGRDQFGQLGNGAAGSSSVPMTVGTLASGMAEVASGYAHSCALSVDGDVSCWGLESGSQLCFGSCDAPVITFTSSPVFVAGGYESIAAGGGNRLTGLPHRWVRHDCFVTGDQGLQCGGYNANGQLGNGTTTGSSSLFDLFDVLGLSAGVAEVSAGSMHTCARTTAGAVLCWGANGSGQLGTGSTAQSLLPLAIDDYADADGDGWADALDVCPLVANHIYSLHTPMVAVIHSDEMRKRLELPTAKVKPFASGVLYKLPTDFCGFVSLRIVNAPSHVLFSSHFSFVYPGGHQL